MNRPQNQDDKPMNTKNRTLKDTTPLKSASRDTRQTKPLNIILCLFGVVCGGGLLFMSVKADGIGTSLTFAAGGIFMLISSLYSMRVTLKSSR